MGELSRECRLPATKSNGNGVSNERSKRTNCGTADKDDTWFSIITQQLAPSNAGLVLHYLTGIEERTCYRYAAGDSQPSGYFIRQLLRSEQGNIWLAAFMEGAEPKWWAEREEETDKAIAFNCVAIIVARYQKAERIYNALAAELRE